MGQRGSGWRTLKGGDTIVVKGGTRNPVQVGVGSNYFQGAPEFDSIRILGGQLAKPPWGEGMPLFDEESQRIFAFWVGAGGQAVHGITLDGFELANIQPGGVGAGFDERNSSSCVVIGGNGACIHIRIRGCYLHDAARDADDRGHGVETGSSDDLIVEYNTIGPRIGTKSTEYAGRGSEGRRSRKREDLLHRRRI